MVTMRRVAGALGMGAMTLYNYVPGKDELLDLMLDAAYLAMERSDTSSQEWRVRTIADENRKLFLAHPWAAHVATTRPPHAETAPARDSTGAEDQDWWSQLPNCSSVATTARNRPF